jgi:peptidoglycan/LPS O-acetylase OafA/YrhL
MKSTSGVYVVGIDHIRAIAALLVFMWHFSHVPFGTVPFGYVPKVFALSIFNEGHTGVALFMVLSGFLFTLLSSNKEMRLAQFYKNRFWRVFPLFFFWCLFGIAVQGWNPADVTRSIFTLMDAKVPANGWTIIVEAQFYLLFPFMHSAVERRYRSGGLFAACKYILPFIGFMWFIRWAILIQTGSVQQISYWTIFGRIDQFLLGALFFYVYDFLSTRWSKRAYWAAFIVSTLGLVIFYRWYNLLGGWRYYDNGIPSPGRLYIFMPSIEGTFYGSIIASYISVSKNFTGRISRVIASIGSVSYSIYLANVFVIPILERLHSRIPFTHTDGFGEYFIWGCAVGFPLICIFSAFTYKFIEQPFLERRRSYVL